MQINANHIVGTHDIVLITLDTLRYDVARDAMASGRTPNLANLIPGGQWEARHTPGNFTYAAHHAFFAGFLPTPIQPGIHPRLFATPFPGSRTTTERTHVFEAPDIVTGLADEGYHTICIGGVNFFDQQTPLGSTLPSLFQTSYWDPRLGVDHPHSTEHQVKLAINLIQQHTRRERFFLFINISAIHPPNHIFLPGAKQDSRATHEAALIYVDRQIPPLFEALRRREACFAVLCSDHGTAYGEEGYYGHRLSHPVVWTVPYAELLLAERLLPS